jgi:hypothetical protein
VIPTEALAGTGAADSNQSAKIQSQLAAWCLLAIATLFFSILLIRILPYMPDAHPTHASEVVPGIPPLGSADIQQLEGTLHGLSASVRFVLIMAAQFLLWGLLLRTARRMSEKVASRAGLFTGIVLLIAQLGSTAMLSSDIYAYITHGRTLALHHVNPSSQQTVLPKDDPYLAPLGSYVPSPYGPLWSLIGGALARVGGDHVGFTVLLFRIAAVLGTLVTAGVLWQFAREICPERAGVAVVFFLCNPLVIFEMGCGGHNDCWMVAPMLAGVFWTARGNLLASAVFFAVAALVKAPAAIVGVFCVLTLLKLLPGWQERLRRGTLAALLGLMLAGTAFGSVRVMASKDTAVRGGFPTLVSSVRQSLLGTYYINSLHEIAFRIGRRLGGEDPQLADATIFFQGWWLKSKAEAALYRNTETNAVESPLKAGALVLVVAPQISDDWVYVYDPAGHQRGFARSADVEETKEQMDAESDPALAELLLPLGQRPLSVRISPVIRLVTWLVFGATFFWLVWRTRSAAELPAKCLVLLMLALFLVASWFWPWYVIWALPLAAIARNGLARTLTIQLSFAVLFLYALTASAWTYFWRAAFVFGLPLLGAALVNFIARARRDSNVRSN